MRKALVAAGIVAVAYLGIGVYRYAAFLDAEGYCFMDVRQEKEVCTAVCEPGKGCATMPEPGVPPGCSMRLVPCRTWPLSVKGPEEQFRHAHQLLFWPIALWNGS